MTASRSLFLKFAAVAGIAALLGLWAPASTAEAAGNEQRTYRTAVPKGQGWRGLAVQARRDYRPYCADVWCGRQFVLILGIGY